MLFTRRQSLVVLANSLFMLDHSTSSWNVNAFAFLRFTPTTVPTTRSSSSSSSLFPTFLSSTTTSSETDANTMLSSVTSKQDDDKNMKKMNSNRIAFSKYEGLGNDFILIDDRDKMEPSLTPEQSCQLCHRNFGIGGDGVIFALQSPNDQHDFAMRIYNSDGSEPEMCGNGIRCLAQFIKDLEIEKQQDQQQDEATTTTTMSSSSSSSQKEYKIHTLAGTIIPVLNDDGTVTVDMGEPILKASQVPTTLEPNFEGESVVEMKIMAPNNKNKSWNVSMVSMGNPHAIIFVNDLEKDVDLLLDGPALEQAIHWFPAKTNVEFVQVLSLQHLKMKVWERGAGPTLACGTGACALVVAAIRAKQIPPTLSSSSSSTTTIIMGQEEQQQEQQHTPCRVTLPGGDLFIEWHNNSDNKVYMTGPATFAFAGTVPKPQKN